MDYETEKNRYDKESDAEWDAHFKENPGRMTEKIFRADQQLATGEISREQYDAMWDSGKLY